jgi:alpha-L-fucosidase
MLVDTVSKGGNLLLNVGPTGRGEFDQRALDRLSGMGAWMNRHSRSIYGCTMAPKEFTAPCDCRLTYNPATNRLYLHCFAWPYPVIELKGFGDRIAYAQLLNDASEVRFHKGSGHGAADHGGGDVTTLHLPVKAPDPSVPVIEIFLT